MSDYQQVQFDYLNTDLLKRAHSSTSQPRRQASRSSSRDRSNDSSQAAMEYTPSLASYDENINRNSALAKRTANNSQIETNKDLNGIIAGNYYHHQSGSFDTLIEPTQVQTNRWDPETLTSQQRNDTAKFRIEEHLDSPLKVNVLSSEPT